MTRQGQTHEHSGGHWEDQDSEQGAQKLMRQMRYYPAELLLQWAFHWEHQPALDRS